MMRGRSMLLLATCLVVPLGWWAWQAGKRDATGDPTTRPANVPVFGLRAFAVGAFRVEGSSMVPTLIGAHRSAQCERCRMVWLIEDDEPGVDEPGVDEPGVDEPSIDKPGLTCAHCGQPMLLLADSGPDERNVAATGNETEAAAQPENCDRVTLESLVETQAVGDVLSRGDLVGVRWNGTLHIKRVVGLPGDTVALDGSRLRINGNRIEDMLQRDGTRFPAPWMLVDDDRQRRESRWQPDRWQPDRSEADRELGWTRGSLGQWSCASDDLGHWLIYEHRSVGRGNLPSPVWDDYPFNVTVTRKLFTVDRLQLRGRVSSAVDCEVAFWADEGSVLARRSLKPSRDFAICFFDGEVSDGLPVTPNQPVAIRLIGGRGTIDNLVIERQVEYRLRPHDDRTPYPIGLGPEQWFVVGDNVPVSTDSRTWGPISSVNIIGQVQQLEPGDRPLVTPLP